MNLSCNSLVYQYQDVDTNIVETNQSKIIITLIRYQKHWANLFNKTNYLTIIDRYKRSLKILQIIKYK